MKDKIKVISLQFLPEKANVNANLQKIDDLLKKSGETEFDLILVPEFFNTGINLTDKEFRELAEDVNASPSLAGFKKLAQKYNSNIVCGSFLVKDGANIYNRSFVLDRHGNKIGEYSKIHLFNYFGGNEGSYTEPGSEIVVVDTDFGKLGLSICFDLRFANHFTELMKKGAEVITAPAAWSTLNSVTPKFFENFLETWRLLPKARALDNLAYVVVSNGCGKVNSFLTTVGHSVIVDFNGKVLKDAMREGDTFIIADLDLKTLREARKQFPIADIS